MLISCPPSSRWLAGEKERTLNSPLQSRVGIEVVPQGFHARPKNVLALRPLDFIVTWASQSQPVVWEGNYLFEY